MQVSVLAVALARQMKNDIIRTLGKKYQQAPPYARRNPRTPDEDGRRKVYSCVVAKLRRDVA